MNTVSYGVYLQTGVDSLVVFPEGEHDPDDLDGECPDRDKVVDME